MEIGDWDWGLRWGIEIGDRGLGLVIGIADWVWGLDWGLGLGIGIRD